MHYFFKKFLACAGIISLACFFIVLFNSNTIEAATKTLTTDDAINEAPSGIDISKYFLHGDSSNPKFKTNSANIVSGRSDIMDLASGKGSVGAYWSNMDNKNYIDLTDTKNTQTISAWLYFGDGTGDFGINGEGMAFVIQNDPNKTNAMGAGYEGLGVYGNDLAQSYRDNITGSNLIPSFYRYPGSTPYPSTTKDSYSEASTAATAVQKSIALEFDSERDVAYAAGEDIPSKKIGDEYKGNPNFLGINQTIFQDYSLNNFDAYGFTSPVPTSISDSYPNARYGAGGGYGHTAITFPGLADSYHIADVSNTNFSKGMSLVHINENEHTSLIDDTDSQGRAIQWHHVTIKWVPNSDGTATLDYSFNDINPNDLTPNNNTYDSKISRQKFVRIDNSVKVDYKKLFGSSATKAYWGMTASNSADSSVEDKLADFESIPALLSLDTDSSIVDHTLKDKTIKPKTSSDDTSDRTVGDGDKLSLNYQLSYNAGRESWKTVDSVINLPKHFSADIDDLGTITYMSGNDGKGSVVRTEKLDSSDLSGSKLKIPTLDTAGTGLLGDSGSGLPQSMIVSINGTAENDTSEDQTSEPVASRFNGTNEISDISSPEFTVRYKKTHKLELTPKSSTIDLPYNHQDAGLTLPTTLKYDDNANFETSPTGTLYYTIKVANKTFNYINNPSSDSASITNNIDLKSAILDGKTDQTDFWNIFKENTTQTVTINAVDQDGITSNTATYTVNVIPDRTISVTADPIQFMDTQQAKETKILQRKNSPNVTVKSFNNPWNLYAEGSDLTDSANDKFNGDLIYKDTPDSKIKDLYDQSVYITKGKSSTTTTDVSDISDNWTKDSGVLLQQNGLSVHGAYTGEITWTAITSV